MIESHYHSSGKGVNLNILLKFEQNVLKVAYHTDVSICYHMIYINDCKIKYFSTVLILKDMH